MNRVSGLFLFLLLGGCSADLFSQNDSDQRVRSQRGYRQIAESCKGVTLQSRRGESGISVSSFRKLVGCLNSQSGIDPLEKWMASLSDEQLGPYIAWLNQEILTRPDVLFSLEESFRQLDSSSHADALLGSIGFLFDLIGDSSGPFFQSSRLFFQSQWEGDHLDPEFEKKFVEFVKEVSPTGVVQWTERIHAWMGSPAFLSLIRRASQSSPQEADRIQIADQILTYLKDQFEPHSPAVGLPLLKSLENQSFFSALDFYLKGHSEKQIADGVARQSAVLYSLFDPLSVHFPSVSHLFKTMDTPVTCFQGAVNIPSLFTVALDELLAISDSKQVSDFLLRNEPLTLASLSASCSFPGDLSHRYRQFTRWVRRGMAGEAQKFLKAVSLESSQAQGGLTEFLVRPGDGRTFGNLLWVPSLTSLSRQGLWEDLLLLIALPHELDRQAIAQVAAIGIRNQEILKRSVERMSAVDIARWIKSLSADEVKPYRQLLSFLEAYQQVISVNALYPLLDLAKSLVSYSHEHDLWKNHKEVIERDEFFAWMQFLSRSSRNGELKNLIRSFFVVFGTASERVSDSFQVAAQTPGVSAVSMPRLHQLDHSQIKPYRDGPQWIFSPSVCDRVRFDVPWDNFSHFLFPSQLENTLACLERGTEFAQLTHGIRFLYQEKDASGKSLLARQVDLVKGWFSAFQKTEWKSMLESAVEGFDSGTLLPRLKAFFQWGRPDSRWQEESAVAPLVEWSSFLSQNKLEIQNFLRVFSPWFSEEKEFPNVIRLLKQIRDDAEVNRDLLPMIPSSPLSIPSSRMRRWVQNHECVSPSQARKREREIREDYFGALTQTSLPDGERRSRWTESEFLDKLTPVLDRISDRGASAPRKSLQQSIYRIFRLFSRKSHEAPTAHRPFRPEELSKWLVQMANENRMVSLFDHGRKGARVRVVSSLDRLALLLVNGNFTVPLFLPDNLAFRFMEKIAYAWGDSPKELWPEGIRKKFQNRSPLTLREAVSEIEEEVRDFKRKVGFPRLNKCAQIRDRDNSEDGVRPRAGGLRLGRWVAGRKQKERIYNAIQVLPVLRENLPRSGQSSVSGMEILRNLFFEIDTSTPKAHRHASSGTKNHFHLFTSAIDLGLLRQLTRQMNGAFLNEDRVENLVSSVVSLFSAPSALSLFYELFAERAEPSFIEELVPILFEEWGHQRSIGKHSLMKHLLVLTLLTIEDLKIAAEVSQASVTMVRDYSKVILQEPNRLHEVLRSEDLARWLSELNHNPLQTEKASLARVVREVGLSPEAVRVVFEWIRRLDQESHFKDVWAEWNRRRQVLLSDPQFPRENWEDAWNSIQSALALSPDSPGGAVLFQLRKSMAIQLAQGDWMEWIGEVSRHPMEHQKLLGGVSRAMVDGDLDEFLQQIRRVYSANAVRAP